MPVYDFSGGINALNSGIDSLGASLKTANQQTQSVALARALASGDWDGAMQAAAAAGDTNTVLKLRELKQSGDQAAAFNTQLPEAIKALYPGGLSGAVGATSGAVGATSGAAGNPANYDPASVEGKIRAKATQLGIDPDQAVKVASTEGLTGYRGDKDAAGNYTSFGPFQLHYAGQGGGMGSAGLGTAFTKATGLDARDPSTVDAQIDFALRQAKQGGWGPWHGWKGDRWAGIGKTTAGSQAAAPVGASVTANTPLPASITGAVYRAADGTTYSGPNAQRDAGAGATPVSQADVPSPGAAPVSGTYPQFVANAPLPPSRPPGLGDPLQPGGVSAENALGGMSEVVRAPLPPARPAGLGDSLAPPSQPLDPAVIQFLASHVGGPNVALKILQAPPGTPVSSLVPPGTLPPDDMAKPAEQLVAEAKQALAGGMAHGAPQTLGPNIPAQFNMGQAPPPAAPPPGLAASDAMGAPVVPPVTPAPVVPPQAPPDPYAGLNPVRASYYRSRGLGPDGRPLPAPVQVGVPASAASAPAVVPPPSAPVPATAPADIAAIERTMPAVQQQAASVGGGQVNDAGMAAASALTSGQPVPAGLGASLQAPVMQALSQGGAPAALAQGPPPQAAPGGAPAAAAALPPSVAVDASGSTPPANAPGVTAATPPPAEAPAPAIEVEGYEGKYTRAQADDSAGMPSQAEWDAAAKEQGIGAAPAPPIDAKLPPTPAAVKAGDPTVTAAAPVSPQVARSLAQTRPGSDQRMMLFALLMRAAANSGPQSAGNVKFVETLMGIEKQHQEDFGKTERIVSPAELAQIGFTPPPGSIVQADPWGNLKVTQGAKPPGHIMMPAEVKAAGLDPVTGTGRVWYNPGDGSEPKALDAPADSKVVPITDEQKKLYPGALGMYEGGRDAGKPFYPPGPQVAIQGESDFMKSMNKRIQTSYDQAVTGTVPRLITLNRLQDSINKGVIAGWGPAQQQAQNVASIFAKLGFGDASKIGNTQEFLLSAAKDYVQTAKGAFPQRITNADIIVSKLMSGLDLSFTEDTLKKAISWQREDALHQIQQHNKDVGNYIDSASSEAEKRMARGLVINPDDLPVPVAPAAKPGTAAPTLKPGGKYIWSPDGGFKEAPATQ